MDLEEARRKKAEIQALVRELEDKEYLSGEFHNDLNELIKTCKYGLEKEDLPLSVKMAQAIEEVKKVNSAYQASLWPESRNGNNYRGC